MVFAASDYLLLVREVKPQTEKVANSSRGNASWVNEFWGQIKSSWLSLIFSFTIGIIILRWLLFFILAFFGSATYKVYWLVSIPFMLLNGLQRFLSKPWRFLYKQNRGNDWKNKERREFWEWVKIPLYILLTPLRLINAMYFNILTHCLFELFNYSFEVISPTSDKEGADNFIGWLLWLPIRFVKYIIIHGSLTVIESVIWTAIDTIVPSLTLWHGTSPEAAVSITQSPSRTSASNWKTGIWNVGGGNFAGNGIYFAPARSTALHYAKGAIIVCRVNLGKVLDLGMAPVWVFNQCGHPNALGATNDMPPES